jgi:hypothetical protein
VPRRAQVAPDRADHEHEEDGRDEQELRADEVELALEEVLARVAAESVPELEAEGDPVVARVPLEDGDHDRGGEQHREPGARLAEARAQRRLHRECDEQRDGREDAGELGRHGAPDREPGDEPPARRGGAPGRRTERAHHRVERPRQRREERRIRRRDHEPRRRERHHREDQGGVARRAVPGERARREGDREAARARDEDRRQTDRERRRTEERRARAHEPGDARRMVEVAAGEAARPLPVVGLVREERDDRGEREPQECGRREDQQRLSPGRRVFVGGRPVEHGGESDRMGGGRVVQ